MKAFQSAEELRARAIQRLTLAAMLASGTLAPLVLCAFVALVIYPAADPQVVESAAVSSFAAAILGGAIMRYGATRTRSALLFASMLGGLPFVAVNAFAYLAFLHLGGGFSASDVVAWGAFALIATLLSGMVSAPLGLCFGLLFNVALGPTRARLVQPAQDAPAKVAASAGWMLVGASAVGLTALCCLGDVYASFTSSILHLELAPATRFLFGLPLPTAALAFFVVSAVEARQVRCLREAILCGEHPEYHPGDIASHEDASPLSCLDAECASARRLCLRDASAYRGATALPLYLGVCT